MSQSPAKPSVSEACRSLSLTFSLSSHRHSYKSFFLNYLPLVLSFHNKQLPLCRSLSFSFSSFITPTLIFCHRLYCVLQVPFELTWTLPNVHDPITRILISYWLQEINTWFVIVQEEVRFVDFTSKNPPRLWLTYVFYSDETHLTQTRHHVIIVTERRRGKNMSVICPWTWKIASSTVYKWIHGGFLSLVSLDEPRLFPSTVMTKYSTCRGEVTR